jgi:hypothetical protein
VDPGLDPGLKIPSTCTVFPVALIVPTPLSVVPEAIAKVEGVLPIKASFPPPMVSSQKNITCFYAQYGILLTMNERAFF